MRSLIRGWVGEKLVALACWLFLDKKVYRRFHDVIVPSTNGTTQIDHVIVSRYGVFVIETKNMRGWIYGNDNQATWRQVFYKSKYSFQNPLRQNYRHQKCLAEYLGIGLSDMHSLVYFVGGSTFKTQMPSNVRDSGLMSYILMRREVLLTDEVVDQLCDNLKMLKSNRSLNRRSHLASLEKRYNSKTCCPKCGGVLVERTVKRGQNVGLQFLGCASYPKCRYTLGLSK